MRGQRSHMNATDGSALHAAVAAERTRLADALHDGALQMLMVARQDLDELGVGRAAAVEVLAGHLEDATLELRTLTSALHEETLEELPLTTAIERVARGVSARHGLSIDVAVSSQADSYHDVVLRDAVRQLLDNVDRHAHADRADVRVVLTEADLLLVVSDDGAGIGPCAQEAARAAGHVGVRRLERQAARLAGSFTIRPGLLGGTVATLRLPRAALRHRGEALPPLTGTASHERAGQSAQHVLGAAEARDAVAHLRDLSALARDHAAEARPDGTHEPAQCGERDVAAQDRSMAAQDRLQAALGRMHALADRNALAAQLTLATADRPTG